MPNQRTDKQGFSTVNPDEERDMASKGGPTTSLGNADNAHDVPHPYDEDTQTQLAAKSTKKRGSPRPVFHPAVRIPGSPG